MNTKELLKLKVRLGYYIFVSLDRLNRTITLKNKYVDDLIEVPFEVLSPS